MASHVCRNETLSNPKPEHTAGGALQGCAHGGAAGVAGPGKWGRRRIGSPRKKYSFDFPGNQGHNICGRLFGRTNQARTKYILSKSMEKQKPGADRLLICGLSPGQEAFFVLDLQSRSPIECGCKCFPYNVRIKNNMRFEAGRHTAERLCCAGLAGTPTVRFAQISTIPVTFRGIVDNFLKRFFGIPIKGNIIYTVSRWKNTFV